MPTLECPTCRRHVNYTSLDEVPHRPFCSPRCQQIDLAKWFNEEYRITEETPDAVEDDEPGEASSAETPGAD